MLYDGYGPPACGRCGGALAYEDETCPCGGRLALYDSRAVGYGPERFGIGPDGKLPLMNGRDAYRVLLSRLRCP